MSWALVVTAVASAAQYANQRNVANKQDSNLAAQLRSQAATRQQAAGRTQQFIQQQAQQTDQPQETAAAKSYNAALTANRAQATAPLATVGSASDAYTKAANDARAGISTYGTDRANNVAAIEAPTQMRRDNVRNTDQYGQDLNTMWRNQRGQDFLSNLKLNGIRPNPLVNILASGAQAYARGMGGGGSLDLGQNAAYGVDLSDPGYTGASTTVGGNAGAGGIDLSGDPWSGPAATRSYLNRIYGGG